MPAAPEPAARASRETPIPARLPGDPRLRVLGRGERTTGEFVVYWAQMYRRARSNAALSYAIAEANERALPLVVYEALRVDYPHASARHHAFVLEGARGEAARYRERGAGYAFFLPKSRAEARGVLRALAARAALVVTDDFPAFVTPTQLARAAAALPCPFVAFDDNAVTPLALFPREEYAARTLRPKVHRALGEWLRPIEEPSCSRPPPDRLALPFDPFDVERADLARAIAALPIDQGVGPVAESPGGSSEARRRLERLVGGRLGAYPDDHNHPDRDASSRLSPYLHFGHVSAREVALAVRDADAPAAARDAFLEQLLVRRTLAFNFARTNPAHATYDAAPDWAKKTLAEHARDARPRLYARAELEAARTGDELWNAAQRELVATGAVHNYLRMLWGKLTIAWKADPREAFDDLLYLNDRYALDGRDPNTYANVLWCFGKHDRPWGPARPIYGTVRYMTSDSARRKLDLDAYLRRWGVEPKPKGRASGG
jgi:deoxyribodipyrimidine photo-lyase